MTIRQVAGLEPMHGTIKLAGYEKATASDVQAHKVQEWLASFSMPADWSNPNGVRCLEPGIIAVESSDDGLSWGEAPADLLSDHIVEAIVGRHLDSEDELREAKKAVSAELAAARDYRMQLAADRRKAEYEAALDMMVQQAIIEQMMNSPVAKPGGITWVGDEHDLAGMACSPLPGPPPEGYQLAYNTRCGWYHEKIGSNG